MKQNLVCFAFIPGFVLAGWLIAGETGFFLALLGGVALVSIGTVVHALRLGENAGLGRMPNAGSTSVDHSNPLEGLGSAPRL